MAVRGPRPCSALGKDKGGAAGLRYAQHQEGSGLARQDGPQFLCPNILIQQRLGNTGLCPWQHPRARLSASTGCPARLKLRGSACCSAWPSDAGTSEAAHASLGLAPPASTEWEKTVRFMLNGGASKQPEHRAAGLTRPVLQAQGFRIRIWPHCALLRWKFLYI